MEVVVPTGGCGNITGQLNSFLNTLTSKRRVECSSLTIKQLQMYLKLPKNVLNRKNILGNKYKNEANKNRNVKNQLLKWNTIIVKLKHKVKCFWNGSFREIDCILCYLIILTVKTDVEFDLIWFLIFCNHGFNYGCFSWEFGSQDGFAN